MSTELTAQQLQEIANIQPDITFKWVIPENGLECKKNVNGLQDYVVGVHWRYQTQYKDIIVDDYGVEYFEEKADADFIPFESLTFETITGWLDKSKLGMQHSENPIDDIKKRLIIKILNILNPPIIRPELPWIKIEPSVDPTEGQI